VLFKGMTASKKSRVEGGKSILAEETAVSSRKRKGRTLARKNVLPRPGGAGKKKIGPLPKKGEILFKKRKIDDPSGEEFPLLGQTRERGRGVPQKSMRGKKR